MALSRVEGGTTVAEHLEQLRKQGIDVDEELEGPEEPPAGLEYLWGWYTDLDRGRQPGLSGPGPLAWQEIESWARLRGLRPRNWELDVLRLLDHAYLTAAQRGVAQ